MSQRPILSDQDRKTVRDAIEILREYGVSQMPVVGAEPPVTIGEVAGSVSERALLDGYRRDRLAQAFILGGPEGVGKATLAWRFARFLSAHPDPKAAAVQAAAGTSNSAASELGPAATSSTSTISPTAACPSKNTDCSHGDLPSHWPGLLPVRSTSTAQRLPTERWLNANW